ncbi:group III truncated hemoglobin [Sulfurovum sp.]|uniref:group III truncated hemoglobin n=1 Tax=Sulfurovum sp. TaxID=1969726 RepID=UPI002867EBB7|nr:group III truncated hemoglobin [Sulfurovum sp.]
MLHDTVDRGNVEKMVRSFYAMIVQDDLVGPFFVRALGSDMKNDKWYEHYITLDKFWLMLMNGEPGYTGDPFGPHAFLGDLSPETFERWLQLFDEHIRKLYVPEIADKFYKKAEILANQFMERLAFTGEEDEDYI